jgi:hypothetical protein
MVCLQSTKNLLFTSLLILVFVVVGQAQYVKVLGTATQSGRVVVSGISSTNTADKTFPLATITIYNGGTILPATIYSTSTGTAKANPFTADANGIYDFFISAGSIFDVRISGISNGVTITPFTRAGYTAPGTSGFTLVQCGGTNDTTLLATASTAGGTIEISKSTTCASNSQTLSAALQVDSGGLLKPLTGQTVTLVGALSAGNYQAFTNATAGLGTIALSGANLGFINPLWWKTNTTPGTTDMTSAVQAALTASTGRGKVHIPQGTYLITAGLTIPSSISNPPQEFSPIVIEGDGPFLSNLVNKAPVSNPTLLINRDLVTVRNLGFWGDENFVNDGIKVYIGGRIYTDHNSFFTKGSAITLRNAQSIWIQNNYGSISGGAGLVPPGVSPILSFAATDALVYVDQQAGSFANHIVIRDNMNENYSYQVYGTGVSAGLGYNAFLITGNQFEGSVSGIKMKYLNDSEISGNYMSEGSTGYPVDLDMCRGLKVGPNYIHFIDSDSKASTYKLNDVTSTVITGSVNRIYATGVSTGTTIFAGFLNRLQDETSDHRLSLVNVGLTNFTIPLATMNIQTGRATWYSDSTNVSLYPYVHVGDQILKVTPSSGVSPGCVVTTASSTGAMVQTVGGGPFPIIVGNPTNIAALGDYFDPVAYDFKIIMLSSGATGTATYKVQWKTAGGGAYADLTDTTTTTELAHLIGREMGSGPVVAFQMRWPTGVTYVSGNTFTLTTVAAPVCKATAALA